MNKNKHTQLTKSADNNPNKNKSNNVKLDKLNHIIDSLNLHTYQIKDDNAFKNKIEKLNMKFYIETEKYLSHKNQNDLGSESQKCQESLFYILFQQISLYIEEVERLNLSILSTNDYSKIIKENQEKIKSLEKDKIKLKKQLDSGKKDNLLLEKRLIQQKDIQIKLKREMDSLNRQVRFFQDKLKMDMLIKKKDERLKSIRDKSRSLNKSFNSNFSNNKIFASTISGKNMYNIITPSQQTYKKSGYYSKSITRQVISSNESAHERRRLNFNSNNFNKSLNNTKPHNTSSLIFDDEQTINNTSLLMDIDLINSTYNCNLNKKPTNLKSPVKTNKNKQAQTGIILNNITTITNINNTNTNNTNKLNSLKFKLSETNIKEIINKLKLTFDEEIKWIEKQEAIFNEMKLKSNIEESNNIRKATTDSSRSNLSSIPTFKQPDKKMFSFRPKVKKIK